MSASYSLFKTHCGASGVEHSTTGNFTSPTDINLIVAKNNIIEIYKLPDETPKNADTKLSLIARYSLFGEVQDIKTARFVPNHCDSLLISFPDAKLSVIDFDASQHNIITVALFNFDPLYRRIGNITSCHDLNIRVDPLQRCAAIMISHDLLFILPLFVSYLKKHKQRKGSNPINIVFHDTLANEHQQEIEEEEQRLNPTQNHNNNTHINGHGHGGANRHNRHNRNNRRNHNKYISPLPPPLPPPNDPASRINVDEGGGNEEEEQEDIDYIQSMKADGSINGKQFDDADEWDIAYQKQTYYHYKSLCAKSYFIINLRAKCKKIVDFIFLDGYNTPQILMLFEKTATWGGRIPVRNKTISLLSMTLNVVSKQYNIPFILCDILSYDFNKLYPISSSSNMLHSSVILQQINNNNKSKYIQTNVGGAFLIGSNAIIHFGQNIDFGLSFNQHGDVLSKDFVLLRKWTERVINLEHCTVTALDDAGNSDFLLSDGDGFMYLLSIQSGKMNLCTFGNGPIPSTMIHIGNNSHKFVFIGSRLADSLLLSHRIRKKKQIDAPNDDKNQQEISQLKDKLFGDIDMDGNNDNKNRKRTFSEMDVDSEPNNDDLAMDLFGITTETLAAAAENVHAPKSNSIDPAGNNLVTQSQSDSSTALRHDSLYGPKVKRRKLSNTKELQIHDLRFMNVVDFDDDKLFELELAKENRSRPISNFPEENVQQNNEDEAQLKQYRLNEQILRQKYVFKIEDKLTNLSPITSVVMSKSHDPRFLHFEYINLMASTGFGTQAKLSIVQEGIRPQILAKTNTKQILSAVNCWTLYDEIANRNHKYLIATDLYQTQVIDISDKIKPVVQENGFKRDIRTIICGHIGGTQMLTVQVYANGVRLLNDLTLIHERKVDDGVIMDAYVEDPFILLHLEDNSMRLLTYDVDQQMFDLKIPNNLARYKEINDIEIQRRKKEFVSRRCNRMTWDEYIKLETCIHDFLTLCNAKDVNANALMEYIEATLIKKESDERVGANGEEREEKSMKSSMKAELSDSDVEIELADDLKVKTQIPSTGWQNNDWRKPKKIKKTLFNLNLNIEVILSRLYGKTSDILTAYRENKSVKDILLTMITKDLDCGEICKTFLFKYNGIKSKTLKQLNLDWKQKSKQLTQQNAATYQQLLSSSFQIKRLDIKTLNTTTKIKKKTTDNKELLTGLFFGQKDNENDQIMADKEHDQNIQESENSDEYFAVIARRRGTLQIFSIPSFELVFECSEIQIGHSLLCNNLIHDESLQIILSKHQLTKRKNLKDFIQIEIDNKEKNKEPYFMDELIPQTLKDELWCPSTNIEYDIVNENEFEHTFVEEIYVSTIDNNPYLLVILCNGDLLIYQMFEYFVGGSHLKSSIATGKNENMQVLALRLNRFKHTLFTRKNYTNYANADINKIKKKMYGMNNINGLRGVLVAVSGNNPAIILSHRGCPVIHNFSMKCDIRGFAIFNHDKITTVAQDDKVKNGCIYFNEYGLHIATIPKSMHNIAFYANVFKDIDIDIEDKEKDEDKAQENKKEEDIEEEEEEKTQKEEDEEDENENGDTSMEIFGHSFVSQKQRLNNLLPYIEIDYNFEYPVCHIPLAETLHFIIKHPQSGTYLLILSRYKYIAGTEMLQSRDIRPIETYFECRLLNPYKWRYDDRLSGFIIHDQTNEVGGEHLNENDENSIPISEHILCAKSVCIQESSRIGSQTVVTKNMMVLGTGTNQGEDSASIGRIVMLEIIPEKDNNKLTQNIEKANERFYIQTKHNSDDNLLDESIHELSLENENISYIYEHNSSAVDREYYKRELSYYKKCMQQDKINNVRYRIHYVFARRERAAVTALNCVNGLIVAAIGPKLLLFRWDGTQLIGCAFLDTRIHCHNILVLKNFVLTADLFQGLDLYHWEQDIASIVKLARDVQYRSIYSVNWRITHTQNKESENKNEFEFVVSDMNQNLHLISYQPHLFARFGFLSKMDKEKLYTKCLFHIGTNISDSIIMKFVDGRNYFNLNVCSDGSISYLIPINEQIYRRLSSLHSQMIFYCKHNCGLNPREYRYCMNNCMTNKDNSGRKSHVMYNHNQLNAIHGCDRSSTLTSKNIIDHDLVQEFINLDYRTQNKLTTNIGVKNANVIINHLKQLFNNTKWF